MSAWGVVGFVWAVLAVLGLIDVLLFGALHERHRRQHGSYVGWLESTEYVTARRAGGAIWLWLTLRFSGRY